MDIEERRKSAWVIFTPDLRFPPIQRRIISPRHDQKLNSVHVYCPELRILRKERAPAMRHARISTIVVEVKVRSRFESVNQALREVRSSAWLKEGTDIGSSAK
jgi:hypothetical protein